jgi:hypothetical protein
MILVLSYLFLVLFLCLFPCLAGWFPLDGTDLELEVSPVVGVDVHLNIDGLTHGVTSTRKALGQVDKILYHLMCFD